MPCWWCVAAASSLDHPAKRNQVCAAATSSEPTRPQTGYPINTTQRYGKWPGAPRLGKYGLLSLAIISARLDGTLGTVLVARVTMSNRGKAPDFFGLRQFARPTI
jgi:hypothetical protein